MLSGTLHVPAEGATAVGIVLNTTSVHAGCPSGPCDKGPDVGWDRPGNDEHCFSVNDTFTATDCASACDRDPKCQAWTLVSKSAKHPANAQQLPCSRGLPLTRPYCTLKAPFPDRAITRSPTATTGVQYFPGQPRSNGTDSRQHRVRYFAQCLRALALHIGHRHEHPCRVAVPWRIGCGLAMGEWRVYASLIMHWSKTTRTADGRSIQVVVYQLPPQNRT